jgi:peptidoglycan hydrolase-like protein with peptidoglycan-binding domain
MSSLAAFERSLRRDPLRLGDPDSLRVRRWRARLRRKGFVVDAMGEFDRRLLNATRAAQSWAGVTPDGIVGPLTWRAVGRKTRTPRPVATARAIAGRPRVIDARNGKAGFPRHPYKKWGKRSRGAILALLGHYTGGPASFIADARFHVRTDYLDEGGAPALAYAIGIDKSGDVYVFNDFDDVTWHCDGGRNTVTLGIVFRGGAEGPNLAQRRALKWVYKALVTGTFGYGYPKMPNLTTTHRHVKATSCPGNVGEEFYRAIARELGLRFTTRL